MSLLLALPPGPTPRRAARSRPHPGPFAVLLAVFVAPAIHARAEGPASASQAPSAHGWYYVVEGQTVGPLDDAAIGESYLAGRIDERTLVWGDGEAQWTPLAKSPRFVELDRWYSRHGSKVAGPMTGAELRDQIARARSAGHDFSALEVRLGWSDWVPFADAAPLQGSDEPEILDGRATTPAPAPAEDRERPGSARAEDPAPQYENATALVTITPRVGVAFPGQATPREISKTKIGFGFPLHIDAMFALATNVEVGSYLHYSVRPITERGTATTDGLYSHLVSVGAALKGRFRVSPHSRLRLGMLLGYNYMRQGFENPTFEGTITAHGMNVWFPSLEWSIDVARHVAVNIQFAAITQVYGRADIGPIGAVVAGGSDQLMMAPPMAFLAFGVDFCLGTLQ